MHTAPLARAAAAVTTALVLSGCGIMPADDDFVDQGPRSMARTAFADMREVTSLRILGSMEHDRLGFTRLDMSLDDKSCTARFTTKAGTLQLIKNAEGAWLKADERYWRSEASSPREEKLLESYGRSWITVREKTNEFADLCDLDDFMKDFRVRKSDTDESIIVGDVVEVDGQDAVPLDGRDDRRGKERTTVWVAVDAPHHVLKMAPTDDEGMPDELFFGSFGVRVDAESPPTKDVITIPGV